MTISQLQSQFQQILLSQYDRLDIDRNALVFFMLQWYLEDNYCSLLLWSWVTGNNEEPM